MALPEQLKIVKATFVHTDSAVKSFSSIHERHWLALCRSFLPAMARVSSSISCFGATLSTSCLR